MHSTIVTNLFAGLTYFESLMQKLQEAHHFSFEPFLEQQASHSLSGLRYVGLAVIFCQKILLCLGDLTRYREIIAETNLSEKLKGFFFFNFFTLKRIFLFSNFKNIAGTPKPIFRTRITADLTTSWPFWLLMRYNIFVCIHISFF